MTKEAETQKIKMPMLAPVFQTAIKNLEKFAFQNESASVPHFLHLELKDNAIVAKKTSFFKKAIYCFRYVIESLFTTRMHKKQMAKRSEISQTLLSSVAMVKKHYLILDRFKNGSEEEQKLACVVQDVITRYNAIIYQSTHKPSSLRKRLITLLYEKMGTSIDEELKNNAIELPAKVVAQSGSPKYQDKRVQDKKITQQLATESSASLKKISMIANALQQPAKASCSITQNEMDAFCMKAITMIKNHAIPITSIREALSFVKENPILATVNKHDNQGKAPSSVVSLSQVLSLFPGETIELQGAFKREEQSKAASMPLSDSFHLFSQSIQNGFPHPSQHHGLALSDLLIPFCPLRLDRLPKLKALIAKKKQIALDLLPNGVLISKGKQLLKLKKQVFNSHHGVFLGLHQVLNEEMIQCAAKSGFSFSTGKQEKAISLYFQLLGEQAAPFDHLSQAAHTMNMQFIHCLYESLEEALINHVDLFEGKNFDERFDYVAKVLAEKRKKIESELKEQCAGSSTFGKATLEYVLAMGELLSPAIFQIILQQQSETFEYAPPLLTDFARIVQKWLYRQAADFHNEFLIEFSEDAEKNLMLIHDHLKQRLEEDVALFHLEEIDQLQDESTSLVHELEDYYNIRYLEDLGAKREQRVSKEKRGTPYCS